MHPKNLSQIRKLEEAHSVYFPERVLVVEEQEWKMVGRNSTHHFYFRVDGEKIYRLALYVDEPYDGISISEAQDSDYWGHD